MMNLDKVEARVLEIEREVTDIQLKGYTDSGEVWRIGPSSVMDCVRLNDLRRELEDITDGENTLHVNHRGQFHPVCRIPLEAKKGQYRDWSDHLTRNADTKDTKVIAPFMRNGIVRKEFFVASFVEYTTNRNSVIFLRNNWHRILKLLPELSQDVFIGR